VRWRSAPQSNDSQTHHLTREKAKKHMGEIIDTVKGKVEEAAGVLTGDKKLQNEGKIDQAKGKAKGALEEVKHAVKEAVKK
jgi:uncharacterized protein YjbJ (UPF0337 family)